MLTAKGKYGLKALVHLARLRPGETSQSQEIAAANNVPKKFLDAILGELRTAGFVHSKKGRGGGYVLARPADAIMVGSIIRSLDGQLAPIGSARGGGLGHGTASLSVATRFDGGGRAEPSGLGRVE